MIFIMIYIVYIYITDIFVQTLIARTTGVQAVVMNGNSNV